MRISCMNKKRIHTRTAAHPKGPTAHDNIRTRKTKTEGYAPPQWNNHATRKHGNASVSHLHKHKFFPHFRYSSVFPPFFFSSSAPKLEMKTQPALAVALSFLVPCELSAFAVLPGPAAAPRSALPHLPALALHAHCCARRHRRHRCCRCPSRRSRNKPRGGGSSSAPAASRSFFFLCHLGRGGHVVFQVLRRTRAPARVGGVSARNGPHRAAPAALAHHFGGKPVFKRGRRCDGTYRFFFFFYT